jgi:hypothetical protein
MDALLEKYLKIQSEYFKRRQLLLILDLISIFSIFYAIFIILHRYVEFFLNKLSLDPRIPINIIPPILAFVIAVIGSYLLHRKDHKINVTLLIEKKYPELREKLRTAYDNIGETNVIVEALKSLVSSGLTIVSASTLMATSVVVVKIVITIIFISAATMVSLNQDTYSLPLDTNVTDLLTGKSEGTNNVTMDVVGHPEDFNKAGTNGGGNIFGKPKIASIEGKNIDLTIYGGSETGFEVRDVSQTQNQFTKSAVFPVDILGSNVSDGGYNNLMQKTETEKQLINKYAVLRSQI